MFKIQQAGCLNNQGINALLCRNSTEAVSFFVEALKILKTELSNGPSFLFDHQERCINNTPLRNHFNTELVCTTVEVPVMETSDTIIFNRVINVPALPSSFLFELSNDAGRNTHPCCHPLYMTLLHTYITVTVFNLALTNQFLGLERNVSIAEKLYERLLRDDNDTAPFVGSIQLDMMVKLACINNLSAIQKSRGTYTTGTRAETARHVSALLWSQQRLLTGQFLLLTEGGAIFSSYPDIQGLLMNALCLVFETHARPAAAA